MAAAAYVSPLANRVMSPRQISADYYYRMAVRPVYKSYPVYYPDREPGGYWESLKLKEPEIVLDESRLRTRAEWIKAGELVFDAPIEFVSDGTLYTETRGRAWYDHHQELCSAGSSGRGLEAWQQICLREPRNFIQSESHSRQ